MNKKLMSIAVASALALPVVNANADAMSKPYGEVHMAFQRVAAGSANATYDIDGTSSKANKLGLKGSVDTNLLDAVAVYQIELGFHNGKALYGEFFERDTWVGLSSKSMGTIRGGTMATAWKSNSALVDPLFTTALEGRSGVVGGDSSNLTGGVSPTSGRATHAVRYDSPSFGGVKVSANYAFNPDTTQTDPMGLGVTWKAKGMAAFFNYQSTGKDKAAMKVGGKAMFGAFGVSGAYEIDQGAIGGFKDSKMNELYLAGTYTMGATTFILNFGNAAESASGKKDNSTGFGLAVSQQLAKKVSMYAGYGTRSGGANAVDVNGVKYDKINALAVGMIAKF